MLRKTANNAGAQPACQGATDAILTHVKWLAALLLDIRPPADFFLIYIASSCDTTTKRSIEDWFKDIHALTKLNLNELP